MVKNYGWHCLYIIYGSYNVTVRFCNTNFFLFSFVHLLLVAIAQHSTGPLMEDSSGIGPSKKGMSLTPNFLRASSAKQTTTDSPLASHSFRLEMAYCRNSSLDTPKTPHSLSFLVSGIWTENDGEMSIKCYNQASLHHLQFRSQRSQFPPCTRR